MKPSLYHIQLNVSKPEFYKDLFKHLNYKVVGEWEDGFGATDGTVDFWVFRTDSKYRRRSFHRKATGLNHLAFLVASRADVKRFARDFLQPRKIRPLYQTPREFPEYRKGYYAVYFEDPDRIKLEVVYLPGR